MTPYLLQLNIYVSRETMAEVGALADSLHDEIPVLICGAYDHPGVPCKFDGMSSTIHDLTKGEPE